jgi:hypothetical protein
MKKEIRCPRCQKKTYWEGNPSRPFCSMQCKLIDLGAWIKGEYVIKGEETEGVLPESTKREEE